MKTLLIIALALGFLIPAQAQFNSPLLSAAHRRNSGWTPESLPNKKLWLNGATLTGSTGDAKTTWTDSSGLGNDAVGLGTLDTALIGGKPGLTFGATGQGMTGTFSLSLSQPVTIYVVTITGSGSDVPFFDTASGRVLLGSNGGSPNAIFLYSGSFDPTVTVSNNTAYYVGAVFNGSSSYVRINGTQTNAGSGGPGSGNPGTYYIGRYSDDATLKNTKTCEVIVVSGEMSGANQILLETYFANKYSL